MRNVARWLIALVLLSGAGLRAAEASRPNIVFILVDDWGWTDAACLGSKFYETPQVDRFAKLGMKFNQAYSACTVCSPSRASILTGKYPARLHITDWIPGHVKPDAKLRVPDWTMYLPLEEQNLAKTLKAAGYATISIGKWHLGGPDCYPDKQGFDRNIAGTDRGQPPTYFSPYKIPTLPDGPTGEFLSDRLAQEAVRFMGENKDRPFFIYLPHFAVHTPLGAKPAVLEKYRQKADPKLPHNKPVYAGLVESVDDSVGTILRALEDLRLAEKTIVILTGDNGGLTLGGTTSNVPLRAGKGSAYEGGVRVPLIVSWPGVIKPGSVCDAPVIGADFYPTLLELCGVKDDPAHLVDGESIAPLLHQSGSLKRDAIFFHYPHYHPGGATPYSAIRAGDEKLIEFFEDNHVELYNLRDDIGETQDLAAKNPERAKQLRERLAAWRQSVAAQLPAPNPDAGKAKPKKKKAPADKLNAGE